MTVISSVVPDWLRNKMSISLLLLLHSNRLQRNSSLCCYSDPVVVTPAGTEYQRTGILELEGENNNLSHAETLIERD